MELALKDREQAAAAGQSAAHPSAHDRLAYLPHVDGLRGLAVLLVVIYHAVPAALPGGFIGVDLFFVISGYIITRQIHAEMAAGEFSYLTFLVRRIRRLLPAATVCFAVTALLALSLLLPRALAPFGRSLAASFMMYANILYYQTSGYFAAPSHEEPLLHTWSLAVEDQFYLTWPLILAALVWVLRSRRAIAGVGLGLAAASLLGAEYWARTDRDFAYYILTPRAFELLAGCALALWSPTVLSARISNILTFAGAAAIGWSAVFLNSASTFPGLLALPLVLGGVALIWAGLAQGSAASRLLSNPVALFLGAISYSLYLWHWPLLALARYGIERAVTPLEAAGIIALSVAIAAASLRWVEQPFRRGGLSRLPAWRYVAAATACAVLSGGLAAVMVLTKGLPQRYDGAVQAFLVQSADAKAYRACDYNAAALADDTSCRLGNKSGTAIEVAVFGDSNARHLGAMLDRLLAPRRLTGRTLAYPGCPPIIGVSRPALPVQSNTECRDYQLAILDFRKRNPGLKVVVLSTIWASFYEDLASNDLAPDGVAGRPVTFEDAVRDSVASLRRQGVKVWLVGSLPLIDGYSERCFAGAIANGTSTDPCGVLSSVTFDRQARARTLFAELSRADPGVSFFDTAAALCQGERCTTRLNGTYLYYDGGHMNDPGAAELAKLAVFPALP